MTTDKGAKIGGLLAVTRIRTWVIAATTQGTNHYTITATRSRLLRTGTSRHGMLLGATAARRHGTTERASRHALHHRPGAHPIVPPRHGTNPLRARPLAPTRGRV